MTQIEQALAPGGLRRRLDPTRGDLATRLRRNAAYAVFFVVVVLVGRFVVVGHTGVAATAPGAAAGLFWFYPYAQRPAWWRRRDAAVVLAVMTMLLTAGNAATGMHDAVLVWPSGIANTAAVVTAASLVVARRRRTDDGRPPLTSGRDVRSLVLAAGFATAVGVAIALTHAALGALAPPLVLGFWAVRNGFSLMLGLVGAVLVFEDREEYGACRTGVANGVVVLATAVSVGLMAGAHLLPADSVFGFTVLIAAVSSAAIFSLRQTYVYLFGVSVFTTGLVVGGYDLFGPTSPEAQSGLVHLALLVTVVVAMTTAADRAGRAYLVDEIRRERVELDDVAREAAVQAARVRAVLATMADGVIVTDDRGAVTLRNPAAGQLLGATAGAPLPEVLTAAGLASRGADAVVGRPVDVTVAAGQARPARVLSARAQALAPEARTGRADHVVVVRDVTDERRQVDELRAFARVVAHDLRQPMSAIDLWADLLVEDGGCCPETREAAVRIREGVDRLDTLLADLATYTLVRDGHLELAEVDLGELVRAVVAARTQAGLAGDGATIVVVAAATAHADRTLLWQVLDNLVGNALKYARPGETPYVEITATTDARGTHVSVADRGVGVPAEELPRIFDEFYRAPGHRAGFPGTGLGLATCRRAVLRHGGSIVAMPREEGGLVVEFHLPAAPAAGAESPGECRVDAADADAPARRLTAAPCGA